MNTQQKFLLKHIKEIQETPLHGINVVYDDLQHMCGNVFFPGPENAEGVEYPGLIIHFTLTFNNDYPNTSPNLELKTNLDHTHVYFPRCCFSLLPDFRSYFEATGVPKSAYWNPSRSLRNFLQSFYTFLVYDVDRESHGKSPVTQADRDARLAEAKQFVCSHCGHTFANPVPERPDITEEECYKLDEKLMGQGETLSDFETAKADLKCSLTGKSIDESIIGFGVLVQADKYGKKSITTDLYPMSEESFFQDKVRTSAGGEKITHFLPFALGGQYWDAKRIKLFEDCISSITGGAFNPQGILFVIGELWKTKVVEMMKGLEHASEKLLIGFTAFHHILLAAAMTYPSLKEIATQRVRDFLSGAENRTKDKCPDFGVFLPLFLISDITWNNAELKPGDVCVAELFARNVFWILKQYPDLADPKIEDGRVVSSWGPSEVGAKLTCFQIRYILEVGRPNEELDINLNWERFNSLLGRPTPSQVQQFQITVKRVQAIDCYKTWFEEMGLGVKDDQTIMKLLQQAVKDSLSQGYTKGGGNNNNNSKGGRGGGGRGRGGRR